MDDIIEIHFPEEKRISAIIDGKEYWFKALFSLSDYEVVIDELEKDEHAYRHIVATIVRKHACDDEGKALPLESLPNELLLRYIEEVVGHSGTISDLYEKYAEIEDPFERFIVSIKENLNIEAEKIRESLKDIKIPQIKIPKELFDIKPLLPDTSVISDVLANIAKSMFDTEAIWKSITDSFQPLIERQKVFISQIAQQAAKVLVDLPSFSLSKEDVEAILEAYQKWGEYGWTIPPHASIKDFWQEPTDLKSANAIASKYCTQKHMQALFDKTVEKKGVRKSDFKEAVDDYNDKRYKSCACIMFSLIDAKLIRMQDRQTNRAVGKGAVDKTRQKICDESDIESKVFSYLRFKNVYACLSKFFEKGNNFVQQPDVMNRNFLDHGMLTRNVIKRDCDQLFLLYYNLLIIMDSI